MKRVLVTGARGLVGRYAMAALAGLDCEVHAVSSHDVAAAAPGVRWHRGNLLDPGDGRRIVDEARATHLLHLAWYAEPGLYWHSPENFRWLEASVALLRLFHEAGGERVVMAGSCAEYDWDYGFCSENVTPRRPRTPYGTCKNALQETLSAYGAAGGLSAAWGRLFFLYGPDEHPARLVASVIDSLARGEVARCTHGEQVRDFLHAQDAGAAFAALLASDVRGAVNIASGRATRIREVVLAAAECLSARERVNFGALPAPREEPPFLVADVRRLALEVGFHPAYDLADGMARCVRDRLARPRPGARRSPARCVKAATRGASCRAMRCRSTRTSCLRRGTRRWA